MHLLKGDDGPAERRRWTCWTDAGGETDAGGWPDRTMDAGGWPDGRWTDGRTDGRTRAEGEGEGEDGRLNDYPGGHRGLQSGRLC